MYDNIGSKLKGWAQVELFGGVIAALIAGIGMLEADPLIGFLVILLGSVGAWLSSLVLYGLGKVVSVAEKYESGAFTKTQSAKKQTNKKTSGNPASKEILGAQTSKEIICPECKESLYFEQTEGEAECPWCGCKVNLHK